MFLARISDTSDIRASPFCFQALRASMCSCYLFRCRTCSSILHSNEILLFYCTVVGTISLVYNGSTKSTSNIITVFVQ